MADGLGLSGQVNTATCEPSHSRQPRRVKIDDGGSVAYVVSMKPQAEGMPAWPPQQASSEMSHAPTSHVSHKFTWQSWPAVQLEGGYSVERLILMFRRQTSNLRRARLKASTTNAPFQVEGRGDETITGRVGGLCQLSRKEQFFTQGERKRDKVSYALPWRKELLDTRQPQRIAPAFCIAFAFVCYR
jgi:hypothetical protein